MANYLRSGTNKGKPRDELLEELSEKYGRSTRQIERYISQCSPPEQERYVETPHKQKVRDVAEDMASDNTSLALLQSHFEELAGFYRTLAYRVRQLSDFASHPVSMTAHLYHRNQLY